MPILPHMIDCKKGMSKPVTNLEDMKTMSLFIAVVIRNAMEDFHVKHLSDAQMRELNPIIRNAVFTAVHATRSIDWSLRLPAPMWTIRRSTFRRTGSNLSS
jgi:hypothetical protein